MTEVVDAGATAEVEAPLEAFERALERSFVLRCDQTMAAEVAREARPVAIALAALAGVDSDGLEAREATALTSLLGRRVGVLGLTPTAMLTVLPLLLEAMDLPHTLGARLQPVFVEGYVAAREEGLEDTNAERMARGVVDFEPLPRLRVVSIGGEQTASALEPVLDELGRRLLDKDAAALLVHVQRLTRPRPETAARVFTLDATCRMLGVRCIFVGVQPDLRASAEERGLDLTLVECVSEPAEAFRVAAETCGWTVRERGFGPALRRFVGR